MCGIGLFDDFSGMGFFGEETLAGNGWKNTLKNQLSVLWGALETAQARRIAKRERGIAPPKLTGSNLSRDWELILL